MCDQGNFLARKVIKQ